jgi:hypothetical protein
MLPKVQCAAAGEESQSISLLGMKEFDRQKAVIFTSFEFYLFIVVYADYKLVVQFNHALW